MGKIQSFEASNIRNYTTVIPDGCGFIFVLKFLGNIMPVQGVSLADLKIKVLFSGTAYMPKLRHLPWLIVPLCTNSIIAANSSKRESSYPSFVESDRQGDIVMIHYQWWSHQELNKPSIIIPSSQKNVLRENNQFVRQSRILENSTL